MATATIATTVTGLQGRPVANTAPTTNQVVGWNGTSWAPLGPYLPLSGGGTVAGNITFSGSVTANSVQTTGNAGSLLNGSGVNLVSQRAYAHTALSNTVTAANTTNVLAYGSNCPFTPRTSGIALFMIQIGQFNATNIGTFLLPVYAAGSPPASLANVNSANQPTNGWNPAVATQTTGAHFGCVVAALTVGTAYWFDLGFNPSGNNSIAAAYVQVFVMEL